jgi:hypothetical protein
MPASKHHLTVEKTAKLMEDWPASWAGDDNDEPVGRGLVALLRPFITDLHDQGLSDGTIRRHLDSLWLIGGEIIREVNDRPSLRRKEPRVLLLPAIQDGHAPLVRGLAEQEQASVDATARKLLRFLDPSNPPLT